MGGTRTFPPSSTRSVGDRVGVVDGERDAPVRRASPSDRFLGRGKEPGNGVLEACGRAEVGLPVANRVGSRSARKSPYPGLRQRPEPPLVTESRSAPTRTPRRRTPPPFTVVGVQFAEVPRAGLVDEPRARPAFRPARSRTLRPTGSEQTPMRPASPTSTGSASTRPPASAHPACGVIRIVGRDVHVPCRGRRAPDASEPMPATSRPRRRAMRERAGPRRLLLEPPTEQTTVEVGGSVRVSPSDIDPAGHAGRVSVTLERLGLAHGFIPFGTARRTRS